MCSPDSDDLSVRLNRNSNQRCMVIKVTENGRGCMVINVTENGAESL